MHQPNIEDIPMTTKTFLQRTTCFPVPDQVSTYPLRTFLTGCPASSTDLNELHLTSCTAHPIWSNWSNQIGVEIVTRRMQIVQLSIISGSLELWFAWFRPIHMYPLGAGIQSSWMMLFMNAEEFRMNPWQRTSLGSPTFSTSQRAWRFCAFWGWIGAGEFSVFSFKVDIFLRI